MTAREKIPSNVNFLLIEEMLASSRIIKNSCDFQS